MHSETTVAKDWNTKSKKFQGKERRNSYHGQKKNNRKRCNGYSRSFEESLPEWVTHEGVWDMETQDPVREFIRAIALDEGYGTCENTITDDVRAVESKMVERCAVPDWDDGLELDAGWALEVWRNPPERSPLDIELYAKFEAKFDSSLEALWARDQNTPDDEYQDLPIDFAELLASPSDRSWEPQALSNNIWTPASPPLHDRLRPLHLASPPPAPIHPNPPELDTFALYGDGDDLYEALATVADTLRSLTAINHSRDTSGFAEVPPRRRAFAAPCSTVPRAPTPPCVPETEREDLLTSNRTHFRPIKRDGDVEAARYADGDTFDIRASLEPVEFERSASGGLYLGAGAARVRYQGYRAEGRERGIDYARLALTPAQREAEGGMCSLALPLRIPVRQTNAAAQTDAWSACDECAGAAKKMRSDIWSEPRICNTCSPHAPIAPAPPPDDLSRDWEELLADISAAHASYAQAAEEPPAIVACDQQMDRKRRHSAALRCARQCTHPHARFLPYCTLDRPLTR